MKHFMTLVICLLVLVCMPMTAEQWAGDTILTEIETPHPYNGTIGNEPVWTYTIQKDGAAWLKPHFADFKINERDYIELVDMYGTVIEVIKGSDFAAGQDLEVRKFKSFTKENKLIDFWGPAIDGDQLTINLYKNSKNMRGHGFKIDQVGVGAVPFVDEEVEMKTSICGADDKVSIACVGTSYQNLGKAVGRMLYQKSGSWYVCTGFLCSCNSSHFLTNEHCITDQTTCDSLQVRFNYRLSTCGGSAASYSTYYGDDFVTDSSSYDFCLVTLTGSPQNTYGYLGLINGNPILNEDIYIIQHPGGRMQEYHYGTVYSTSANGGKDLSYYVDTEGGSSGSPVFAELEDEVIGLHHYGGCPNSAVKMNYIYEYITGYLGCN